jgi:hypothetical protein
LTPPRKVRERNRRGGIIGDATRASNAKNAASKTMPAPVEAYDPTRAAAG